jgi:hypothetical protein
MLTVRQEQAAHRAWVQCHVVRIRLGLIVARVVGARGNGRRPAIVRVRHSPHHP